MVQAGIIAALTGVLLFGCAVTMNTLDGTSTLSITQNYLHIRTYDVPNPNIRLKLRRQIDAHSMGLPFAHALISDATIELLNIVAVKGIDATLEKDEFESVKEPLMMMAHTLDQASRRLRHIDI